LFEQCVKTWRFFRIFPIFGDDFWKNKRGGRGEYSTSNGENSPQNKRWLIGIYDLKTEIYKRKREREERCL
jgi:hypothetical protein